MAEIPYRSPDMKDQSYDKLEKLRLDADERRHKRELAQKDSQNKRELIQANKLDRRAKFWDAYSRNDGVGFCLITIAFAIIGTPCVIAIIYAVHNWTGK